MKKLCKSKLREFVLQRINTNSGSMSKSLLEGKALFYLYGIYLQKFSLHPQFLYREVNDKTLKRGELYNVAGIFRTSQKELVRFILYGSEDSSFEEL